MARVFVGIPTLNRPRLVQETVHSVLEQTIHDLRVVVSDNASEPEAGKSVAHFIRQLDDPRVRFHSQPRNVGEYGQGRFFFREASDEEFFVILHDDDVLKPRYLEKAVRRLEESPDLAGFVARPYIMDEGAKLSADMTRWYVSAKRLARRPEGPFDILSTLLRYGFPRISGACFRTSALRASGLVDDDCSGNYPFEFNVLLRLGERGARAWYCAEELLGFRFHGGSMINYIKLLENPDVVSTMIVLVDRRCFAGANERRRRAILGRLYRASALIRMKRGDHRGCRQDMARSLRENPRSARSWALAPLVLLAPRLVRAVLPPPPEVRFGPRYEGEATASYRAPAAKDT